jgi:hypothetical protein
VLYALDLESSEQRWHHEVWSKVCSISFRLVYESVLTLRASLPLNQVPGWEAFYLDYKALRKLVRTASETVKAGGDAILTGWAPA